MPVKLAIRTNFPFSFAYIFIHIYDVRCTYHTTMTNKSSKNKTVLIKVEGRIFVLLSFKHLAGYEISSHILADLINCILIHAALNF